MSIHSAMLAAILLAASGGAAAQAPADGARVPGLSQQQIASCSEEIRRTQLDSQTWPGNVNDVAARLGRFQKDLFEGRCAGHPEAQAYIAGANRMLGYGGTSAGSLVASPDSITLAADPLGNTTVGRPIQNDIGGKPLQRSDPRPMRHIENKCPGLKPGMSCGGIEGGNNSDRVVQENRERERAHKENVKRHEEEVRRNQAARAEAIRKQQEKDKAEMLAKLNAKAAERAQLEAKIQAALSRASAITSYPNSANCEYVFTNTTEYWITVVWDYTVVITYPDNSKTSFHPQTGFEVPPRQTQTQWVMPAKGYCGQAGYKWDLVGGTVAVKDNLNNYPFHLR